MEAYSSSYSVSNKSHSVRKAQTKPWKKTPVAPPAPKPVRVYKVDAINFRDLVQQLTGAPELKPQVQPRRDIDVDPSTVSTNWYQVAQSEALELNLSSPSSNNWFSVPLV